MTAVAEFLSHARDNLSTIEREGRLKRELPIASSQAGHITISREGHSDTLFVNLAANNYLGYANHPEIVAAAKAALDLYGSGLASARFITGTHALHLRLEERLASYLERDAVVLFCNCFDANLGLFEALLGPEDAIVSDSLNHASIIDGIRLSKARRYRFAPAHMSELSARLEEARSDGARFIMIATDGVFSMDGCLADLPSITALAAKYDAIVMVDDSHATGIVGPQGRGTAHRFGVAEKVHLVTGTFGKALGGALGGYVGGPKEVIDLLRQRARPYVFSNALPISDTAAGLAALDLAASADDLREDLKQKTSHWRAALEGAGFRLLPGEHPIVPVIVGDEALSQHLAEALLLEGIRVVSLQFPVVPAGQARIRTQVSAALSYSDLDSAAGAFTRVGRALNLV